MMKEDSIVTELLTDMLAKDLDMIRDENGDYELPQQHITREYLETIASMIYETITVIEIEKFGEKLMEVNNGKRNESENS